jgi:hypothetical protein
MAFTFGLSCSLQVRVHHLNGLSLAAWQYVTVEFQGRGRICVAEQTGYLLHGSLLGQ